MSEVNIGFINGIADDIENGVAKAEKDYYDRINQTVETVNASGNVRVILLAGPSASGKTTTANILKDAFIASGRDADVISLDNFYRPHSDPDYPRFENGALNMECVEALNVEDIRSCISDVLAGGRLTVPVYDFTVGDRKPEREEIFLEENGVVILEGLHALNPVISDGFSKDSIFRIFVSVSTNINENGKRLISGKKLRFARRVSRDRIYRGMGAARTARVWNDVLKGENLYLYPYKDTADLRFDTFHAFEPGVLKKYVFEALAAEAEECSGALVKTVAEAFEKFRDIPLEAVPEDSLIREFVPGGIYEELY